MSNNTDCKLNEAPENNKNGFLAAENELVLQLVGSWEKKSGELASMRFLINSNLGMDALKKVGVGRKKVGSSSKKEARYF